MVKVCLTPLLKDDDGFKTKVWIADRAKKQFEEFVAEVPHGREWLRKARRYSKAGFKNFPKHIVPEGGGVFAIGPRQTLFRLYGFYPNGDDDSEFIVLGASEKDGKKRDRQDTAEVEVVKNFRDAKSVTYVKEGDFLTGVEDERPQEPNPKEPQERKEDEP